MRKIVRTSGLALCAGLLAASCFGPFHAVRRVHAWNADVSDNKWGQELVFLVISIIPVYGIAALGDVLIFNSIEFWGGENPVDAPAQ
jgi:hypothetical protein